MGNCFSTTSTLTAPTDPTSPTIPTAPTAPTALTTTLTQNPYELATYENTPEYTLKGLRTTVKILRVIDGDTVDIALLHPDTQRVYRHRVRLWGIDTPEKKPSLSDPYRHLEIEASYRAKTALEERCQEHNHLFTALFYSPDKYGRLLCTFYGPTGEDINQWMITQGHAKEYFGKTKKKFFPAPPAPSASPVPSAPSPLTLPAPALPAPALPTPTLSPSSR